MIKIKIIISQIIIIIIIYKIINPIFIHNQIVKLIMRNRIIILIIYPITIHMLKNIQVKKLKHPQCKRNIQ